MVERKIKEAQWTGISIPWPPEMARADKVMRAQIFEELVKYKNQCFRLCRAGELPRKSALSFRSFQPWSGQSKSPACYQSPRCERRCWQRERFSLAQLLTVILHHAIHGVETCGLDSNLFTLARP
jgi:hypothetical protein